MAATANLLQSAAARYARYRIYSQTYGELVQLGDRELADLGLSRSMLRGLAWETAQE